MAISRTQPFTWRRLYIGGASVVGLTLSVSAAAEPERDKDQSACAGVGAPYGSPSYSGCMLQQQQRRDQKMSAFLEQQLMHQELGRPARERLQQKRERREREKENTGCRN
jgi:hypothetical protein